MSVERRSLRVLARHHGVQLEYRDTAGRRRRASDDALLAVLRALGAGVETMSDVPAAATAAEAEADDRLVPPVVVAWDGGPAAFRSARSDAGVATEATVVLADGTALETAVVVDPAGGRGDVRLEVDLPAGVHALEVRRGDHRATSSLVSAPRRAHPLPRSAWGVVAPCYSLRDARERPVGDLTALAALGRVLAPHGAAFVGTLPLLPPLAAAHDPSPYAAATRRFWNELTLDPARLPGSSATAPAGTADGDAALVDWAVVSRGMEEALDAAVSDLTRDPVLSAELDAFLADRPDVTDYARFRAGPGGDPAIVRRHEYAQWRLVDQVDALVLGLTDAGQALYLDLPIGTARAGFDVRIRPDGYALDASVGAPPDAFFPGGQNWGFPPPRPAADRADGYADLRHALDHHMRVAGALRIDHVMGLHRLFVIPSGIDTGDGVYVGMHPEERWAVVCEASRRHRCAVVGEDLGTVPTQVRRALAHHGVAGMWVAQFATPAGSGAAWPAPTRRSVASLGTHDLPTWSAFWDGADIDLRTELGHLDGGEASCERRRRADLRTAICERLGISPRAPAGEAQRALHSALASSRAALVTVALGDVLGERDPVNVPGTTDEVGNWRRRSTRSVEALVNDEDARAAVAAFAPRRGKG